MEPNINSGLAMDGDLTRQQLRDIGWFRDTTADKVADTVTAVTPNSGFAFIGEAANITWTNSGSFNRNITIELSTDGGVTYPTVIASNIVNTGSYTWTTPNSPTTNALIRSSRVRFRGAIGHVVSKLFDLVQADGSTRRDFRTSRRWLRPRHRPGIGDHDRFKWQGVTGIDEPVRLLPF